ncbi:MAG: nitrite/sulfite reductase [Acidobacteria bacterium]|nr:nitrite/sulfite reductase [Acidobacteriota bacterium]
MPTPQEIAYDQTVREDIELFRQQAEAFTAGQLTDDQFRAVRLRRGIYGQRQPGVHMVRTKVPAGMVTVGQMHQLASIADDFGGGRAHLTTRQNVQYHFVPLARVPDLLHKLADVRLTTREACYNTVRNVTACPVAGIAADEVFDVRPYARKVAFSFLHKDLTDNLPRKFKIAFAGCKDDCVATSINDLGFRAVKNVENGAEKRGFRVTVGGGLGPLPTESRLLMEFLPAERVVNLCEAVIRVFNLHGNRGNKNKARLKFVLRERGFDWLKETIEREYQDILVNGGIPMPEEVPEGFGGYEPQPPAPGSGAQLPILQSTATDPEFDRWLETNVEEQKQAGYSIITIRVPEGNLTGRQMHALADLASDSGDGYVRFSMNQNILLGYIPVGRLRQVYAALQSIGLEKSGAYRIDDITNCPGAYSCNLALTKSMNLGEALGAFVKGETDPEIRKLNIHISGCPNSCGQHWTGDLGFYGNARKVDGKQVPYYQMLLGGAQNADGIHQFGLAIQSIPARLIPQAISRVFDHYKQNRQDGETFRNYVLRFKVEFFRGLVSDLAKPSTMNPEFFMDWGDEETFSLQLGRGECAS